MILSDGSAEELSFFQILRLVLKTLNDIQADVVVLCGYGVPGMPQGLLWSIMNKRPSIVLSDSKEDDAPRNWLTENIKRIIIRNYSSALVAGRKHKLYLVHLGMKEDSIFLPYDVVGNEDFHPQKIGHLSNPCTQPYFLAINRFVPKKNLLFLLSAYASYRQKAGVKAWDLVLCGSGELLPQIEQKIHDLGITDYVHLPGFLQQEQLLPYFAHAKCFIHASIQEQWGLVVNEAMAAGLPVLVSNLCGCFEELVKEGVNGFGFDPEDEQQLTNLMLKMSSGEIDLVSMGRESLAHIANYSPETFAQGLKQAIDYALGV